MHFLYVGTQHFEAFPVAGTQEPEVSKETKGALCVAPFFAGESLNIMLKGLFR